MAELAAPLEGSYQTRDTSKLAEEEMSIFRNARKQLGI